MGAGARLVLGLLDTEKPLARAKGFSVKQVGRAMREVCSERGVERGGTAKPETESFSSRARGRRGPCR